MDNYSLQVIFDDAKFTQDVKQIILILRYRDAEKNPSLLLTGTGVNRLNKVHPFFVICYFYLAVIPEILKNR